MCLSAASCSHLTRNTKQSHVPGEVTASIRFCPCFCPRQQKTATSRVLVGLGTAPNCFNICLYLLNCVKSHAPSRGSHPCSPLIGSEFPVVQHERHQWRAPALHSIQSHSSCIFPLFLKLLCLVPKRMTHSLKKGVSYSDNKTYISNNSQLKSAPRFF